MKYGTVKMWNSGRGFGFITDENGDDLFVNANDIHPSAGTSQLREGQQVRFDRKSDMKGDRAVNVRLVKK